MDGVKATLQLIEAGGSGIAKSTGKPKVSALEELLGVDVNMAQRDEWYDAAKKVIENGGDEPATPPAGNVRRVIRTSGLGSW
jgi:hypothetical protein